jgi:hypothetical protein
VIQPGSFATCASTGYHRTPSGYISRSDAHTAVAKHCGAWLLTCSCRHGHFGAPRGRATSLHAMSWHSGCTALLIAVCTLRMPASTCTPNQSEIYVVVCWCKHHHASFTTAITRRPTVVMIKLRYTLCSFEVIALAF